MNFDFRMALFVFCMHYHSGQWSRLYRIMCKLDGHVTSNDEQAIAEGTGPNRGSYEESHRYYLELVELYGNDTK